VRSGVADGTLIEDAGIVGQSYDMTRDDIFHGNRDLMEYCGKILASQPRTRLDVSRSRGVLKIETLGLDQLDVYIDGHPGSSPVLVQKDGQRRLRLPGGAQDIQIVGFSRGVPLQRRRLDLNGRS
jgi:hypothetical protein